MLKINNCYKNMCMFKVGCSYKFLGTVHTRKGPKTRILVKFNRYTVCEKV